MYHRSGGGYKVRFANVVTRFFPCHNAANKFRQVVVRSATPHEFVQIMVPDRKQAGANLAIRSDPNAAAMSAERVRHRSNDPDFPDAIVEAITPRRLATLMRNFDEWPIFRHALQNFIQRDYDVRRPH